jgi:hypothetical protein
MRSRSTLGSYGRHFIDRRRNGTLIEWVNSDRGQLGAEWRWNDA